MMDVRSHRTKVIQGDAPKIFSEHDREDQANAGKKY